MNTRSKVAITLAMSLLPLAILIIGQIQHNKDEAICKDACGVTRFMTLEGQCYCATEDGWKESQPVTNLR